MHVYFAQTTRQWSAPQVRGQGLLRPGSRRCPSDFAKEVRHSPRAHRGLSWYHGKNLDQENPKETSLEEFRDLLGSVNIMSEDLCAARQIAGTLGGMVSFPSSFLCTFLATMGANHRRLIQDLHSLREYGRGQQGEEFSC